MTWREAFGDLNSFFKISWNAKGTGGGGYKASNERYEEKKCPHGFSWFGTVLVLVAAWDA